MLVVGLTGGIASGKSTVSKRLRELGAAVIDYDLLAREVVEPGTDGLRQIAERFGPSVIAADGQLDRPGLGAIVFADPAALQALEQITHPAIRQRALQLQASLGDSTVVVHDNPLLVEMGAAAACDVVIVVDAFEADQVARMVSDRGMTESDALARIRAQASRDERLAVADYVLTNAGTLDELTKQVDTLWAQLANR